MWFDIHKANIEKKGNTSATQFSLARFSPSFIWIPFSTIPNVSN